jgi:thymidylate synthase (FAD)
MYMGLRKEIDAIEQFDKDISYESEFSRILDSYVTVGYRIYQKMLELGAAKEQARFFLPGWINIYTAVISMNARNLMHFLNLRMDEHAQYEIRVYAQVIYDEFFKPLLPWTAEAFEEYILGDK